MRLLAPAAVAVTALLAFAAVAAARDDDYAADLSTGYLLVYLRSDPSTSYALEQVRVARLGDRCFLVGRRLRLGGDDEGEPGRPVWVSLTDVSSFHVYVTQDGLKKARAGKRAGPDRGG